jgi:hypothetical protein
MSSNPDQKTLTISAELYARIVAKARRDSTGTLVRGAIKEVAERAILAALEAEEREN